MITASEVSKKPGAVQRTQSPLLSARLATV